MGAFWITAHGQRHTAHDIKLEVDVLAQDLITKILLERFPDHALYGEEGIVGDQSSDYQWVVDPLDGTVNFFYGIPHFCVSIALRERGEIIVGVIYDPMRNELWSGEKGQPPPSMENRSGQPAGRTGGSGRFDRTFQDERDDRGRAAVLEEIVHRVRKCRMLGSAALDMAYVACGRLDAYIEQGISLWDIAAGWLLVETAGGRVEMKPRRT